MPFRAEQGCCSASLRQCCAIGGIVGLTVTITAFIDGLTASKIGYLHIFFFFLWIALIAATFFENEFLLIVFFVLFAIDILLTILGLFTMVVILVDPDQADENMGTDAVNGFFSGFAIVIITFLIAAIVFRYAYSYFRKLREGE